MQSLLNESRPLRCAIYARKSAKQGLDKDIDWVQQRVLLGFPSQVDPGHNEERY